MFYLFLFSGVVKIIRQEKRQGLMRSRMAGIRASSASVLVFLDSHIAPFAYAPQTHTAHVSHHLFPHILVLCRAHALTFWHQKFRLI